MANDSWAQGADFSPVLNPYMEQIHDQYGAQDIILPPKQAKHIPC
jgi:hypothetical protein